MFNRETAVTRSSTVLVKRLVSSAITALLVGCSAIPIGSAVAQSGNHSETALSASQKARASDLMYDLMIAELAGRRGYLDVAMAAYLRAAGNSSDPRVADRAARLASFGRQWPDAEIASRRWLELTPDASDARELLAQSLIRQDKLDAATDELILLVDGADERSRALQVAQALLQNESDADSAMGIMQTLSERFPEEAEAALGIARMHLSRNAREPALASVEKALEIEPSNSNALLIRAQILTAMGRPTEGFDQLRTALSDNPEDNSLRLGYAQLLVGAGRYEEASDEFEGLFESADGDADVLLTISLLALDSRRIEQAERFLEALLSTGEYPDQAHFYTARIRDQQQEFSEAIQFYDAVQGGELVLNSRIRAAELHAAIGELDVGRARLAELATVLPDRSMKPRLLTAESRMLQEVGEFSEAVIVLTEGLVEFPGNSDLLYARALAADNAGDSAMLEADLGTIIEAEPDNADALNALGYFLADANERLDEASRYLEKANTLKPDDPAIMDSLGWLRYRQGDYANAITLLRQAYALYPDGEIAAHLGEALWKDGDQDEARAVWGKALTESPDDQTLLQAVGKFVDDPETLDAH